MMPALQLLIKPASGLCNMRCSYCFYTDISHRRENPSYGFMSDETLERVIEEAFACAEYACTFTFQGGEPLLAGLSFYKRAVELQKKYNRNGIRIRNAIQTNGYALDEAWCRFFAEQNFLAGLSLDGIKATHDACRRDAEGRDTFFRVLEAASLLEKAGVEYNIVTVVNGRTAPRIRRIYEFYRKQGFRYQQYIACLDPLFGEQGKQEYSLSPERYGEFLKELFDLWYLDLKQGRQPYIRQFENYVAILLGRQPESCEQRGVCSVQHVVEADGSVYPCDFYVLDQYRLGNLKECGFEEIEKKRRKLGFIEASLNQDAECKGCRYFPLCRGGCNRRRTDPLTGVGKRNRFCLSYRMFFDYSLERLREIAEKTAGFHDGY